MFHLLYFAYFVRKYCLHHDFSVCKEKLRIALSNSTAATVAASSSMRALTLQTLRTSRLVVCWFIWATELVVMICPPWIMIYYITSHAKNPAKAIMIHYATTFSHHHWNHHWSPRFGAAASRSGRSDTKRVLCWSFQWRNQPMAYTYICIYMYIYIQ